MTHVHQNEKESLLVAMKTTKTKRMYERYQTIYFYVQGFSIKEIMNMIGRSEKTIYNYVNAYKEKGLHGLLMGQSTGAPRKLAPEQEQELVQVSASHLPVDVGFPAKHNWTLSIIASFIKREWNVSYTLRGVSRLLHDLGLSYTKPTYTLAKADPVKQQEFREVTFPAYKKKLLNEEIDHLLFQDESMIRDYQALQHTWFLKGKQRSIPTYGKHQGVKLIGTLNYETGELVCVEEERYDAEAFLRFLQHVLELYPNGKIALILDNARIHHAKLIQPLLRKHCHRLELVFLPPYSPDLNLIEGVWKWLKSDIIHNVFYSSIYEIQKNVQAFIQELNRTPEKVIDRLCIRL